MSPFFPFTSLVTSVVVLPVFIVVVPLASTLILGASVSEHEKTQMKLIMENLRALSDAKAKWVAQTRVTEGAKVTVAGLALYLDGKEIKSIVGETYDPKPVGEEPTATLPPTKSLASHKKGAVITAGGSSLVTGQVVIFEFGNRRRSAFAGSNSSGAVGESGTRNCRLRPSTPAGLAGETAQL